MDRLDNGPAICRENTLNDEVLDNMFNETCAIVVDVMCDGKPQNVHWRGTDDESKLEPNF